MAIVYRSKFVGEQVVNRLKAAGIPVEWVGESNGAKHYDPSADSVKVITMHSSKGLEFPVVAIPGLGYMPYEKFDVKEEAKLLYVAMTRAMEVLLLTCHRETEFVTRIKLAREKIVA
jgi:superfamily I DNA/RNA helicase